MSEQSKLTPCIILSLKIAIEDAVSDGYIVDRL